MFEHLHPVTISSRAVLEIKNIMETKNIPKDYGLRVGVRGGGCGGVAMMIGFDKQKASDVAYSVEGIPVFVDKKHTMYLIGKEVDFHEGDDGRGFMFVNQEQST